jgi:YVTN family beta-propeller protein
VRGHFRTLVITGAMVASAAVFTMVAPARAATVTSAYIPVAPSRLLDTRQTRLRFPADSSRSVTIAGVAGIPLSAVAVAVNLTIVDAGADGFVTAWPSGTPRPTVSNVNAEQAGQTVANAAVITIGRDGAIDVYTSTATDFIIDVFGAWVPATTATAGRYVPLAASRVFDSRNSQRVADDSDTTIDVAAPGASAVVVNLTGTGAMASTFVSLRPSGTAKPVVSNLNIGGPANTVANMAIVPVGADGRIVASAFRSLHLIVDVVGYFTGPGAAPSTDGLYVPITPQRAFDSRSNSSQLRLRAGPPRTIAFGSLGVVPASGVAAVVATVTATNAVLPGFITVYPSSTRTPATSNLNIDHIWQTVANMSVTAVGPGSAIVLRGDKGAQVLVDVSGYFTGTPFPPSDPPPVPGLYDPIPEPASNGLLVADSTVRGEISPKSVVATGTGLVLAQNMMYQHSVTVYGRDGTLLSTISDRVGQQQGAPVEMAMAVDGLHAYVSNYSIYGPGAGPEGFDACTPTSAVGESTVYRIDLGSLGIDQVIPVGRVPKFLAATPDGKTLIVSNWCGDDISIIDTGTAREVRRIPVGRYPRGLAITGDSRTAYVALMGDGKVATVDLTTGTVVSRTQVGAGARHLNLSPDNKNLYVTLNEERSVVKLDVATGLVVGRAVTGSNPRSSAMSVDGTALFVVNYSSATASKVRTSDMTVVQTVSTAANPIGITYDDETRQLWVSCYVGEIRRFVNKTLDTEIV